ncbi:DUF1343 domain-containing protein [uncultured Maribacter sp.]|uniref:exo-beta-N-acetylmuramidase NamZ family protein n=1 Tax=uncultured Maribacter sp. TaxID=431308 RepID=UPI0026283579|nr:DUF1343 domain-containing protein [uncultured Maribacter sp.]
MMFLSGIKSTFLLWFFVLIACGNQGKTPESASKNTENTSGSLKKDSLVIAANRIPDYLPMLRNKKVGIVANQTSVIFKKDNSYTHLVDSLLNHNIEIKNVFSPEHGFRGKADAGEKVKNSIDTKTGLPIISLHGKNRKPTKKQIENLDIVVFDIQDVGVRFYTYIATLQLVMEACAENNIPILVLDRPNPNAHYIDGPTMEAENTSFLGMTEIPLVYGMTIGEYAQMINEEGWLTNKVKASLTVIPLQNWTHTSNYNLPIRPSPNLPNATAISLYPSLGLFEGTNVNAGRGTEFQFQRYGASFLDSTQYSFKFWPRPNFGSKNPKEDGKKCYGKDLSDIKKMNEVTLKWLIDAYNNAYNQKDIFLKSGFTKHAGTEQLQQQIEAKKTEKEIKETWQPTIEKFKKIRKKYLLYI